MSPVRGLPLMATTGVVPNALKLWEQLDKWGGPAITIPHTSSLPSQDCDWSKHNEKYQRLVEMFQACRGSFEGEGGAAAVPPRDAQGAARPGRALETKYRLGIICSTDHGYGSSYACVYAKENTREAVFDALYDRRTYGSTAYGIIVDFNVNGVMMGRDVKRGDGVTATGYVGVVRASSTRYRFSRTTRWCRSGSRRASSTRSRGRIPSRGRGCTGITCA